MKVALPGDPEGKLLTLGRDNALELPSTSHLVARVRQQDLRTRLFAEQRDDGFFILVQGPGGALDRQPHRTGQAPAQRHGADHRPARRQACHAGGLAWWQRHHQLRGQDDRGRAGLGARYPVRDCPAEHGQPQQGNRAGKGHHAGSAGACA
ncbi:hypothetical protein G6F24_016942 [Rhizopus arrhizus]|nr:hypothetical protein G6F24_016942 [Rhizopus arrhizus]